MESETSGNSKGFIGLLIVFTLMVLGLGGWIVYDKYFAVKVEEPKESLSEPINETFRTDESCIDSDKDELYFKTAKEVSLDKSDLIESDYELKTSIYCYEEFCETTEAALFETYNSSYEDEPEYKLTKKSGFSTFRLTVKNGVLTVYNNYNKKDDKVIKDTKKLSLKGVKGLDLEFSAEGYEGSYRVLVLDENDDLYLFDSYDFEKIDYGMKLIYQNVKNFAFENVQGVFAEPVVSFPKVAVNTNDGKSYLINLTLDKTVNLNNMNYMLLEINDDPYYSIYASSSNEYSYEKYNGNDIVVKGIFVKDLTINIITENNEHLYYKLDDCEHRYRLYVKGKVDSFIYNDSSKKVTIIYEDQNKKEFDFDYKLDLKGL